MKKIFNNIGWPGAILIITFICVFIWGANRHKNVINNAAFVNGLSLGISKSVRGSMYLYYEFKVNETKYKSHVATTFCKECDCCKAGEKVIVMYQKDDPENNDLVSQLPAGAVLEIDP